MVKQLIEGDRLFFIAESLAKDFSLFPQVAQEDRPVPGLLSQRDINRRQDELRELNIDAYIEAVVAPAEDQGRIAAPVIIRQLGRVIEEQSAGPYYQASVLMNLVLELSVNGLHSTGSHSGVGQLDARTSFTRSRFY